MSDQNPTIVFQPKPRTLNDLDGQTFGNLTVLGYAGSIRGRATWHCRCGCGNVRVVRNNHLTDGTYISCKTCSKRRQIVAVTSHGQPPEYGSYTSAKSRCTNPKDYSYARYGGRGIEFRFESFERFLAEVGKRPTPQHSIDRYPDNDGHYEPGNVRWATKSEQQRNKRNNVSITIDGQAKTIGEWSAIADVPYSRISERIHRQGWCGPCAVELPVGSTCPHR